MGVKCIITPVGFANDLSKVAGSDVVIFVCLCSSLLRDASKFMSSLIN